MVAAMNKRKAKKRVKRKWHLDRWPGNSDPRKVDFACMTAYVAIRAAVDEAFAKAIEYSETFRQVRAIPAPEGLRLWAEDPGPGHR